jgi:hypothetical protein
MKYFALILFTLVLSGCGGGGGSSGSLLLRDVPFYTPTGINHYSPLVTSVYVTPSTEMLGELKMVFAEVLTLNLSQVQQSCEYSCFS